MIFAFLNPFIYDLVPLGILLTSHSLAGEMLFELFLLQDEVSIFTSSFSS